MEALWKILNCNFFIKKIWKVGFAYSREGEEAVRSFQKLNLRHWFINNCDLYQSQWTQIRAVEARSRCVVCATHFPLCTGAFTFFAELVSCLSACIASAFTFLLTNLILLRHHHTNSYIPTASTIVHTLNDQRKLSFNYYNMNIFLFLAIMWLTKLNK